VAIRDTLTSYRNCRPCAPHLFACSPSSCLPGELQKEVVIREPGERYLGTPQHVCPEARKDLDFARLSQSAYEKMKADKSRQVSTVSAVDTALRGEGWVPWPNFPDDGLQQEIANSHLRVQVWTNPSRRAVAVAFGGTILESGKDWRSNFRWFIPHHEDEYTEIVRRFAPAFAAEFLKRKEQPEWAFLQHAPIYATGHSLGGGLAQQFAYSLPKNQRDLTWHRSLRLIHPQ
jgi:hypothetical protein